MPRCWYLYQFNLPVLVHSADILRVFLHLPVTQELCNMLSGDSSVIFYSKTLGSPVTHTSLFVSNQRSFRVFTCFILFDSHLYWSHKFHVGSKNRDSFIALRLCLHIIKVMFEDIESVFFMSLTFTYLVVVCIS